MSDFAGFEERESGPSWARTNWPLAELDELNLGLDPTQATIDKVKAAVAEKAALTTSDPQAIRRAAEDSIRAMMLIRTYRVRGHLAADLDPLHLTRRQVPADLTPEFHGFTEADLDRPIWVGGVLGFREASVREIVHVLQSTYCGHIGMAHRGRLNILTNVMGKPYRAIFHEFAGGATNPADVGGSGDVKYHLGTSSDREFDGIKVHLSLLPNPSHLEAVDPVVLGKTRAVQTIKGDTQGDKILPMLLHGDASFAGQGVVWECLSFSGLPGYGTGGTIHFIINNQVGFTTSPQFARSSPYPSDVAKGIQAPILHVNGDDPEAVTFCCKLAIEFRQRFNRDIVIDMWCYRRFGHNEGDEPSFTQPLMYQEIRQHPPVSALYGKKLVAEVVIDQPGIDKLTGDYLDHLEAEFESAPSYVP